MTADTALDAPTEPRRIAALPKDHAGRPVPWFVAWIDGKPDFRVIGEHNLRDALRFEQCWICGQKLGRHAAFVIGPMCAVNRVSAEPPSHRDCAEFAAKACPFLTRPSMRRRTTGLPENAEDPAGIAIRRNPGVALVWVARDWKAWSPPGGGVLFDVGNPDTVLWFAEGREATRAEVMASIDSGLPLLRAEAEKDGLAALEQLHKQLGVALALVPAEGHLTE